MGLFDIFKKKKGYKFNTEKKRPIKLEELENFENENKVKFPELLRNYLLEYGDAPIKECNFKDKKYSTNLRQICSPLKEDNLKKEGFIPHNFYAIAYDSGGNYFYWNAKDNKIYMAFNDDIDNPFVFFHSVEEMFKEMEKSI